VGLVLVRRRGGARAAHGDVHRRRAAGMALRPAARREGRCRSSGNGGASRTRTRRSRA
jgi:hypothetical protein